ncbi:MAG: hypothetical protein ACSLE1_15885 [Sphingobium sp.]
MSEKIVLPLTFVARIEGQDRHLWYTHAAAPRADMRDWLVQHIDPQAWSCDFADDYSVAFEREDDAMLFMLRFGDDIAAARQEDDRRSAEWMAQMFQKPTLLDTLVHVSKCILGYLATKVGR